MLNALGSAHAPKLPGNTPESGSFWGSGTSGPIFLRIFQKRPFQRTPTLADQNQECAARIGALGSRIFLDGDLNQMSQQRCQIPPCFIFFFAPRTLSVGHFCEASAEKPKAKLLIHAVLSSARFADGATFPMDRDHTHPWMT